MTIFFTSDHHFGHENIIKYTGRPFGTVESMDDTLIHCWNEVVGPCDTVWHLGDFTLFNIGAARDYLAQLNGIVKFLTSPWHHDKRWLSGVDVSAANLTSEYSSKTIASKTARASFEPPLVVLELPELGDGRYPLAITLCHYPLAEWDRKHHGAWHLHGHSHGNHRAEPGEAILDVGVDNCGFAPVSLEMVKELMAKKTGT